MTTQFKYYHPALTVDIVVFGYDGNEPHLKKDLSILLIKRGIEPFKGQWALPGGFVRENEDLETAARRELAEEAGLKNIYLEQLYTFGQVDRDPRERVVSVAYFALVNPSVYQVVASTDAESAKWFQLSKMPKLAFDHEKIIEMARKRLKNKIRYEPIGFELLPKSFTLTQLQNLYETVVDSELDKRNFRKKILSLGILKEEDKKLSNVSYRSPQLYSFEQKKYQNLSKKGITFEI